MYTAKQMREDARLGKFTIMVISVTGECNLNCEFCAYDAIKRHKKMSYDTLNNIFDEIDRCGEDHKWLICWSGGEPTYDIDHLVKCQKMLLDRPQTKSKVLIQAMMTNCWWANNEDVINKIKGMHLDVIGVSASECHIKEVPEENMIKIMDMFKGTETTVWSYFNGKCMDLYPTAYAKTDPDNMFAHTTRRPNWSIWDCYNNLDKREPYDIHIKKDPCGFYIHPDGKIGSCCSEEGNCPCILGNVNKPGSLLIALGKLAHAKTRNIVIKNCPLEYGPEWHHHGCRFCKEAGYDASCFTDKEGILEIEFEELLRRTPKELESHKKY